MKSPENTYKTNARDVCKPALHKIVNDPRAALTTEEEDLLIYEGWHDRDFGGQQ